MKVNSRGEAFDKSVCNCTMSGIKGLGLSLSP